MKRFKYYFIIMCLMVIPIWINAKSVVTVIEEGQEGNYKIDGNYGWTFNMKNTTVKSSNYHEIRSADEAIREVNRIEISSGIDYEHSSHYYLESENDCTSNKIYITYNNVGMYQGKVVNLKVTVKGCKFGNNYSNSTFVYNNTTYNPKYPSVGFNHREMQILINGLRSVNLDYEFLDNDGNVLDVKGYGTFADLDYAQAFKVGNGIDKAYIYENYSSICKSYQGNNCTLSESGQHLFKDKITKDDNYSEYNNFENAIQSSALETKSNDKYAWATMLFSGGKFNITYYLGQPGWEQTFAGGGMYKFYPNSLVPFTVEDPVKSVSKENVIRLEEYTYTTSHRVPYITLDGSNNQYSEYSFNDILEPCLNVLDESKIIIKNDEGLDVTDKFNIKLSEKNGSVVVDAKAKDTFLASSEFYGHEYEFIITAYVKDNYDLSKYLNSDKTKYVIPNQASISVHDNSGVSNKNTNKVDVVITILNEVVETPDTGEFISSTLIVGGSIIIILAIGIAVMYKKNVIDKRTD